MEGGDSLKQNILAVISGLLGEETELRNVAEDRRKALEFKPEYPAQLADILHDTDEPVEERLMCADMLGQYINQFWEFKSTFCTIDVKVSTRTLLLASMGDENPKVVDACAYLLGAIAQIDYPHAWPDMLSVFTEKLHHQDQRTVIGGVTFLQECFGKIPELLQEDLINDASYNFFYNITERENDYNSTLRSKVVDVVTSLIIADFVRDKNTDRVAPTANKFASIMGYILNQPYGLRSDFQLKAAIVSAYSKFLTNVPDLVGKLVISTLPIIWDILIACAAEYRQIIAVRANSNAFLQSRIMPIDTTEESGYPAHFMTLIDNIFTMIHYVTLTEGPLASVDVDIYMGEKNLTDIFHAILIFGCASPYTERDIYKGELEYIDDDFMADEVPAFYVAVTDTNSSRAGLKHLLRSVIKSSRDLKKAMTCLRTAIIRSLEYMQLRRAVPPPEEVAKLKSLEDSCDETANAADNAGHVPVQRPLAPQPIYVPPPGGYDLYSSRVAEGIMWLLCGVSSLVGSPEDVFTPMVQPALLRSQSADVHHLQDRPGASGMMGISGNLDNLMLGFGRPVKTKEQHKLTQLDFNIREFLTKFLDIAQNDDVLLQCRLTLTAAHYAWIFGTDEYRSHLRELIRHLQGGHDICRHAAMRALSIHCTYLKGENQTPAFSNVEVRLQLTDEFLGFVPQITNCLLTLSQYASIDMLNVIIGNLTYIIMLNKHAPEHMVEFVMKCLTNYTKNAQFVKNVKMLIEVLSCGVGNKSYFQVQLFQRLVEFIRNASRNVMLARSGQQVDKAVGLELFAEMLRMVDDPQFRNELISLSFRCVHMGITSGFSDVAVARNGQRCLSMYFLRFGDQMMRLGANFPDGFYSFLKHMMHLSQSEEFCVGLEHPFLCMLVYLREDFLRHLDGFVKSLLSRLNHTQSLDARDSLIMMFLGIFFYHNDPTMRLLDMLPGPDGTTSALVYIIPLLLDVHYNSAYTQSLYVTVISSIMQQTFLSDDRRMVELLVEHNNYVQAPGAAHIVHNRHVLQPGEPLPVRPAHRGINYNLQDSDIPLPPLYRATDSAAKITRDEGSLLPILTPAVSVKASSSSVSVPSTSDPAAQLLTSSSASTSIHDYPIASDAEVESMDVGFTASISQLSTSTSMELRYLESALSVEARVLDDVPPAAEQSSSMVPFLRKAFRMLLDVLLTNRRMYTDGGSMIFAEGYLFPDADPLTDIRQFHPQTMLATMEVVPVIEKFFSNMVEFNYLERYNLCESLHEAHKREVNDMLQEHISDTSLDEDVL